MASEDKPNSWNYLDFELELSKVSGSDYSISVIHSPTGEAKEVVGFPYRELELDNSLKDLKIALLHARDIHRKVFSKEEFAVQDFGERLFDFLISREVRSLYDVSKREAALQEKGLRLKLRIQPPELAALPWEFLYDSRQAEFICLSRDTPVVRYLDLPQPILPLEVAKPLRILGMISSPSDLPQLNAEIEKQRVQEALKHLTDKGAVEIAWLEGQTWRDLQTAMLKGPWNIFHFIGHGGFDRNKDEGIIALADENGKATYMNATKLGRLLADHKSLRLVVLNSCEGACGSNNDIFSSTAAILVRRGIPAVLAMQYEITDTAAIEFSRTFYESLSEGLSIDASVAEGRKAVDQSVPLTLEWGVPVLYMRAPDGILFNLEKEEIPIEIPEMPEKEDIIPTKYNQISDRVDAEIPQGVSYIERLKMRSTYFVREKIGLNSYALTLQILIFMLLSWNFLFEISRNIRILSLILITFIAILLFKSIDWLFSSNTKPLITMKDIAQITFMALIHEGQNVLSASSNGSLSIWNLKNGEEVRRWKAHDGSISYFAVTQDGKKC